MNFSILGNDDDDDDRRNSKNIEEDAMTKKERNKVIDTEDCSRGPLSGCIRLADSSRVISRLKVSQTVRQIRLLSRMGGFGQGLRPDLLLLVTVTFRKADTAFIK